MRLWDEWECRNVARSLRPDHSHGNQSAVVFVGYLQLLDPENLQLVVVRDLSEARALALFLYRCYFIPLLLVDGHTTRG